MVVCERRLWNKTTIEVRYYLSSLDADAQVLAYAVRTHWGVENSVHWTIDVTFQEDASRIRTAHSAQNFALLRRIALYRVAFKDSRPSRWGEAERGRWGEGGMGRWGERDSTTFDRNLVLNQLQRETSVKSSIRQKRYRAALDNQYAVKVLLA